MDVDGTQEDTQTAIKAKHYGIEVDFESLSEEAQEVCSRAMLSLDSADNDCATGRQRGHGKAAHQGDLRPTSRD
jgi:hypothetical protein